MACKLKFCAKLLILPTILVLSSFTSDVYGLKRYRRPGPPPPPLVKVGKDVISLNVKPGSGRAQTVDIAPLLESNRRSTASSAANPGAGVFILRRKTPASRNMNGFRRPISSNEHLRYYSSLPYNSASLQAQQNQNRRSYNANVQPPILNSNKANLAWIAMLQARQRQRALLKSQYYGPHTAGKSQYHRSLIPLLYQYKMQKQAADKYYTKYLRTLQLLALATSMSSPASSSPELAIFTKSFKNSPYGSLLNNSSFVSTNPVDTGLKIKTKDGSNSTSNVLEDQIAQASERSDLGPDHLTAIHQEFEKQKRKLLEVFPPPQSEVPFGERTILMVRFPPVPEMKKTKEIIRLTKEYDIDGGITFGGPRWLSFGTPFDPFDHPWYHTEPKKKGPSKIVIAEAEKSSSYGVIITQNFIYRPSIRFTNSDPKSLAKHKGDLLNGGPSIVTQLAKALAEGNRISNSYFLSKNTWQGKTWANPKKKPPFIIVHLDTYTKKSNETGSFGLDEQVEANYANGTIIYPTENNPNILASTKFEFHNAKEIDHIFDKPLAILGHGYGWGKVPVHPKGIKEIKNFLRLMYKVHQEAHDGARKKSDDLIVLGDQLKRPAFNDSKPLLRDQIADRSVNWLHTSSVGIRSLSEDDDHFPYAKHPVVDVSKDYGHFLV